MPREIVRYQLRRGTAAEWADANPVLADGEPGVERNTGKQKIGDGVTAWNALPYTATTGATGPAGPATTNASLLTSGTVPEGRLPARLGESALAASIATMFSSPNMAPLVAFNDRKVTL